MKKNNKNFTIFEQCDASRPWGLYFQDSVSPYMEALIEWLYTFILFSSVNFLVIALVALILFGILILGIMFTVNSKFTIKNTNFIGIHPTIGLESGFTQNILSLIGFAIFLIGLSFQYKAPLGFAFDALHLHYFIYILSAILIVLFNIMRKSFKGQLWTFNAKDYKYSFLFLAVIILADWLGYPNLLLVIFSNFLVYSAILDFHNYKDFFTLKLLSDFWNSKDMQSLSFYQKFYYFIKSILNNIKHGKASKLVGNLMLMENGAGENQPVNPSPTQASGSNPPTGETTASSAGSSSTTKKNSTALDEQSINLSKAELKLLDEGISILKSNYNSLNSVSSILSDRPDVFDVVKKVVRLNEGTKQFKQLSKAPSRLQNTSVLHTMLESYYKNNINPLSNKQWLKTVVDPTPLSREDALNKIPKWKRNQLIDSILAKLNGPDVNPSTPVAQIITNKEEKEFLDLIRKDPGNPNHIKGGSLHSVKVSATIKGCLVNYRNTLSLPTEQELIPVSEGIKRKATEETVAVSGKKAKSILDQVPKGRFKKP